MKKERGIGQTNVLGEKAELGRHAGMEKSGSLGEPAGAGETLLEGGGQALGQHL